MFIEHQVALLAAPPEPSLLAARPRAAAAPGASIRLRALREQGRVVDFIWAFAGIEAARLLHCDPLSLHGKGLRESAHAGPLCHPALIERYRRVLEHGQAQSFEQVHRVNGRQELVIHRVVCEGDGVAVILSNLSANRRTQALRLRVCATPAGPPRSSR